MYTQARQVGEATIYSDQYEPSCPLCQSGAHTSQTETNYAQSSQFAAHGIVGAVQAPRGRVVYTTPERIVSQKIVEGQALSPLQMRTQQAFTPQKVLPPVTTQVIQTPPIRQSPIVVQQSPVIVNQQQMKFQQSPAMINKSPIILQQQPIQQPPMILQQPQYAMPATQTMQTQQIVNQQTIQSQQQSQALQQAQFLQSEYSQKVQQQQDELAQQSYAYYQLQKAYQEQQEAYAQLQQVYSQQTTHTQYTNFIPSFLQTTNYKIKSKDGVQYTQEEVELYWRHKVFELEEQVYQLWEKINLMKQRKNNPAARSDDETKIEQLQTEVNQLEHILRLKSNSVVQLRNNLNDLMYQYDPATEATREQDHHLQQLRQQVMQLTSQYQDIQDDIQMTEAQTEAIKSGKGFKFVSEKQTISQVRQTQNSVRTTQQQQSQYQGIQQQQ